MIVQKLSDGSYRVKPVKDASPEKKKKFELVKKKMHPDFKGKLGILVNRGGATTIVNEIDITEQELNKLYKRYYG